MKKILVLTILCLFSLNIVEANESKLEKENSIQTRINNIGTKILNSNIEVLILQKKKQIIRDYNKKLERNKLPEDETNEMMRRNRNKKKKGFITSGEIGLPMKDSNLVLPCGIYGKWEN